MTKMTLAHWNGMSWHSRLRMTIMAFDDENDIRWRKWLEVTKMIWYDQNWLKRANIILYEEIEFIWRNWLYMTKLTLKPCHRWRSNALSNAKRISFSPYFIVKFTPFKRGVSKHIMFIFNGIVTWHCGVITLHPAWPFAHAHYRNRIEFGRHYG